MSDHPFKDLEDKENERRKAIGLPPLPLETWRPELAKRPLPKPFQKGARKEFADYSLSDVDENVREHRELKKNKYSGERLEKYMESYKIGLMRRIEAAIVARGGELKPTDSLVVSDKNGLKSVPVKDMQGAPQQEVQDPAKLPESIRERMYVASTGGGFKDRFPSIAKLVNFVATKQGDEKKEKTRQTEELRKQVEQNQNVGVALEALSREQEITVKLLRELLNVIKERKTGGRGLFNNRDGDRTGPSLSTMLYGGLAAGAAVSLAAQLSGNQERTEPVATMAPPAEEPGAELNQLETEIPPPPPPPPPPPLPATGQVGAAAAVPGAADVDAMGLTRETVTPPRNAVPPAAAPAATPYSADVDAMGLRPETERVNQTPQPSTTSQEAIAQHRAQAEQEVDNVLRELNYTQEQNQDFDQFRERLITQAITDRRVGIARGGRSDTRRTILTAAARNHVTRQAQQSEGFANLLIANQPVFRDRPLTEAQMQAMTLGMAMRHQYPDWLVEKYNSQRQSSQATPVTETPAAAPVTPAATVIESPATAPTAPVATGTETPAAAPVTRVAASTTPLAPQVSAAPEVDTAEPVTDNLATRISSAEQQGEAKAPVPPATKVQQQEDAPKAPEAVVSDAVAKQEVLYKQLENNPDTFSNRTLMIRARNVKFKGDEIEFEQPGGMPQKVGGENIPTPGAGNVPGGLQQLFSGGGGAAMGGGGAVPADAAVTKDLKFAPGVDNRIQKDIAEKVKETESASGKSLTITSGFRDPTRNAAAGGARNSAHTSGKAVDIQFRGNVEDTVNLIQKASASGIGGIGVYRPGFVHLDTGPKRVWGPDYTARSIPDWAKEALQAHMTGQRPEQQAPAGDIAGAEAAAATPVSGGEAAPPAAPAATPEPAAPTTGMEVAQASVQNEVAARTPEPPTVTDVSVESGAANPSLQNPSYSHSMNDPGPVEPADAAQRYAMLFNMAA